MTGKSDFGANRALLEHALAGRSESPVWVPHGPNCICRPCRLARARAERLANRPRPTRSDEAAEKIAELRGLGYTLTEIAAAAELSVGVVHKASRPGAFLRASTAEAILELEVVS